MRSYINKFSLMKRWEQYWLAPVDPRTLAVARLLFFGCLFFFLSEQISVAWATVPDDLWLPISFFKILSLSPPTTENMEWLVIGWRICTFGAFAGLLTPFAVAGTALLSLYLVGLHYCYGYMHPADANLILFSFVLIFSGCGRCCSMDAWIRKSFPRWGFWNGKKNRIWPLRLIWILWALMFFSAGLAKLRWGGLDWIRSDNLRNYIGHTQYWFHFRVGSLSSIFALWMISHPLFCRVAAGAVVAMELILPLSLLSGRGRQILVPLIFLFQIGNAMILMVDFNISFAAYIFFVNWAAWGARFKIWPRSVAVPR